ncbi:hypothetical protein V6N13_014793 [Hibiscus sabdariffa]
MTRVAMKVRGFPDTAKCVAQHDHDDQGFDVSTIPQTGRFKRKGLTTAYQHTDRWKRHGGARLSRGVLVGETVNGGQNLRAKGWG